MGEYNIIQPRKAKAYYLTKKKVDSEGICESKTLLKKQNTLFFRAKGIGLPSSHHIRIRLIIWWKSRLILAAKVSLIPLKNKKMSSIIKEKKTRECLPRTS